MTAIHHFHLKAFRKAPSHMQGLYAPLRLQLINWLRFVNGVNKVLSTATSFWSFQVIIWWLIFFIFSSLNPHTLEIYVW